MIPLLNASGVLPPFAGGDPATPGSMSPYPASMTELTGRFASTPERVDLLSGLIKYRAALAAAGITNGYQFIDGSFVEACETLRGRSPRDIDVVTFAYLPVARDEVSRFFIENEAIFTPVRTKVAYKCDAYFVDLGKPPHLIVADVCYWTGLLSHQRVSALWKGLLAVPDRKSVV